MRRLVVLLVAVWMLSPIPPVGAQNQPVDVGKIEEVKVRLALIDTLVMDKQGTTIADLTKEDFSLKVGKEEVAIDTFDVHCPAGAEPDPKEISRPKNLRPPTSNPQLPRRVVFVFDYYTIGVPDRQRVLDSAAAMLQIWKPEAEEIMIAVIADGLRIEQGFTKDVRHALRAMQRMEHDTTLWPRTFTTSTGRLWFDDLATLMDVLAAYDGSKAVVLFSDGIGTGTTRDLWYDDVVQRAAVGRTMLYPTFSAGLQTHNVQMGALARLANETGGRMPPNTSYDLSISYARAQRDLGCRYALGFYIDAEESAKPKNLRVYVNREKTMVRYPERFRMWTDEQVQESRTRAAFHDPEHFESALVRALAFPVRLKSKNSWDVLLAANFLAPVTGDGITLDVGATLMRGAVRVGKYKDQIEVKPPKEGKTRSVTVLGDSKLKPGQYTLTVVASEPSDKEHVASAKVDFTVPEVPAGVMILRGPFLARVMRDGLLVRPDKKSDTKNPNEAVLRDLIGEDGSFEPLLVHEVRESDTVLALWEACMVGKDSPTAPAVVDRRVVGEDGEVAHQFDLVPLELRADGKALCGGKLDHFDASVLKPGEYTLDVVVQNKDTGNMITRGSVPLLRD